MCVSCTLCVLRLCVYVNVSWTGQHALHAAQGAGVWQLLERGVSPGQCHAGKGRVGGAERHTLV